MLLIISSQLDPHVDAVVEEMRKNAFHNFMRIDLGASFFTHAVSFGSGKGGPIVSIRDLSYDRFTTLERVRKVWWRRMSSVREGSFLYDPPAEAAEINECAINLKSIIEALPEEFFPFGHPWAIRAAENKFLQFDVASKVGLDVPSYLFSSDSAELKGFADCYQELVVKPTGIRSVKSDQEERGLYVKNISGAHLIERIGEKKACMFLQERVNRVKDVRAFIGNDFCFASSISVENLPGGEVDWRPYTMDCQHAVVEVPADTLLKSRAFLNSMKIPCGHFDFIVAEDGNWKFLECNPNGQWLWLEIKARLPISSYLAGVLGAN